jgi:hypothetical protein
VIAKVEHHLGELFPRVGFIVTTLTGTNRAVVRFYDHRRRQYPLAQILGRILRGSPSRAVRRFGALVSVGGAA